MDIAVQAAAIGIVAVIAALLIKKHNAELARLISVAAGVVILLSALTLVGDVGELIDKAMEMSGMSRAVLVPVLKCVAIGMVTKLGSDICRDAGGSGVASSVELAGALAAVCAALPLMQTFLKMMEDLM